MARKKIQKAAPANYWVPENIPKEPKLRCIVADPPWTMKQTSDKNGNYGEKRHRNNMIRSRVNGKGYHH